MSITNGLWHLYFDDPQDLRLEEDCVSCGEDAIETCEKSRRACGHHCNCSWIQDKCCWCGEEFGEMEEEVC